MIRYTGPSGLSPSLRAFLAKSKYCEEFNGKSDYLEQLGSLDSELLEKIAKEV